MTQTALVTGINRGIGQRFAKQLTKRGYYVIGTCRNPVKAPQFENLTVKTLDIRDDQAIQSLAQKYENTPIDLLINNAGVLYGDAQMAWGRRPY